MTQEDIFSKFPFLYRERNLSSSMTCMCWGLCISEYWFPIIYELSEKIQKEIDTWTEEDRNNFSVAQVKEKFGGLRFYCNGENEKISEFIKEAEHKASKTCIGCGSELEKRSEGGWSFVPCLKCKKP
jgi:hypothetical protein